LQISNGKAQINYLGFDRSREINQLSVTCINIAYFYALCFALIILLPFSMIWLSSYLVEEKEESTYLRYAVSSLTAAAIKGFAWFTVDVSYDI
jgi:hypothetical protein